MRIFGVDFTSRPTRRKPITCVEADLSGERLIFRSLVRWHDFHGFEAWLRSEGPWVAGLDFPFGQARRFIENIGWPGQWAAYVERVAGMDRQQFRAALDDYRRDRPPGDKEHRRATDRRSGAVSSQKLYGVPVALMFYEGVPRLLEADVNVPPLRDGDLARTALEAYPGALARLLVGRRPYKNDDPAKQGDEQYRVRQEILATLASEDNGIGIETVAPASLADDPSGDELDAWLCAIQAAWAFGQENFGIPANADELEGWIVGPAPVPP